MPAVASGKLVIPRRVPQRTCVGCRTPRPKRELIRLVCLASGRVEVDPTGKKSGRGAYLCGMASCWELGLKRGKLARALRAEIAPPDRERLAEYARHLNQRPSGDEMNDDGK